MIYKHIIAVTTGNLFIKIMAFSGKYFVTKLQAKENRCITESMEVNHVEIRFYVYIEISFLIIVLERYMDLW